MNKSGCARHNVVLKSKLGYTAQRGIDVLVGEIQETAKFVRYLPWATIYPPPSHSKVEKGKSGTDGTFPVL